jgi:hypothetical protein
MEKIDIARLASVHQALLEARHTLDDIAFQEQEELDRLPLCKQAMYTEPLTRATAVSEAVCLLMQAEEALELALSCKYSIEDRSLQDARVISLEPDTTYFAWDLSF